MNMEQTINPSQTSGKSVKGAMRKAGAFFLILMVLELPLSFAIMLAQKNVSEEVGTLISVLTTQIYLLLAGLLFLLVTKTSLKHDLNLKNYKVSTFFLSILALITATPMATFLNIFSQLFVTNVANQALLGMTEILPVWLGVLIIGCLPGFVEELLFRGIMYSAFKKYSILVGIIISAFSFGIMHMNFNQMLYAIYLGIVFALIVEATGSLASSMVLHMLFNGANTLYVYILPKLYEFLGNYSSAYANLDVSEMMSATPQKSQILMMVVMMAPIAIGGVVLTILLLQAIAKINGRTLTMKSIVEKKTDENVKPVGVCLIFGWLFCLAFCIINLFE